MSEKTTTTIAFSILGITGSMLAAVFLAGAGIDIAEANSSQLLWLIAFVAAFQFGSLSFEFAWKVFHSEETND